ncbi:tRNA dihydrouridine(20/20a) synthase DusA [Kangiella sp. TOML190]|uniref:tRNA dihydrouridine(20/20a) synthase DusA n=1 Tax=Kangiella sp. TOML190 TaxID=2931351 RepID=UPI00204108DE|nr:tRNA dihydrouridine(20/20a) synthase DusA [Kangiella sp. TOML190]
MTKTAIDRTISIAPMLDWTDRHQRRFMRIITKRALLYTEMITTGAILHGDAKRHLQFNAEEHPVAVQLGGSDPKDLALCAKICEDYGYDEINLNVGCPSDRVQNGRFGACLMAEPELVAECMTAMDKAVSVPVTVKSRIGIDDLDSYEHLHRFIATVADAGVKTFIIHARKAWLSGLSPKQNREIPPLKYDVAYQVKQDFPELEIIVNGGITNFEQIDEHLQQLDGVMIGREAYHNPYFLAEADSRYYKESSSNKSRQEVAEEFIDYAQSQIEQDIYLGHMTRHILGLFHAQPKGKLWRRYLSENAYKKGAGVEVIKQALQVFD